jgi:NTP pyrophosphatase (non-canonical NTP hydrolase)
MKDIKAIQKIVAEFAKARDWDKFHSPKNLSMALSIEASELMEHFQWLTEEESYRLNSKTRQQVAEEIADVQVYLARLADKLDIDIFQAVENKMIKNNEKYPAEKVFGSARKYSEYSNDE